MIICGGGDGVLLIAKKRHLGLCMPGDMIHFRVLPPRGGLSSALIIPYLHDMRVTWHVSSVSGQRHAIRMSVRTSFGTCHLVTWLTSPLNRLSRAVQIFQCQLRQYILNIKYKWTSHVCMAGTTYRFEPQWPHKTIPIIECNDENIDLDMFVKREENGSCLRAYITPNGAINFSN